MLDVVNQHRIWNRDNQNTWVLLLVTQLFRNPRDWVVLTLNQLELVFTNWNLKQGYEEDHLGKKINGLDMT